MKKFTFKTTKPTGRYKAFEENEYSIKMNNKEVGTICNNSYDIRLMVVKNDINEDNNPNCIWKWITLKKKSSSLEEAKKWLNDNFEEINKLYNLHQLEN